MKNKNKKIIIISIVVILMGILIPFKINIKDGFKEYKAIAYTLAKYDDYNDTNKLVNGNSFKLFGFKVYDDIIYKEKEDSFKLEPLGYKWSPYVYNSYLLKSKGEDFKKTYNIFLESLLTNKDKAKCKDRDKAFDIVNNLVELFPPFSKIISNYYYEDNYMHFVYAYDSKECEKIIKDFGKRIEEIINNNVMKSDNKVMAAISLYHFYSSKIVYDYDALVDNYNGDLSAYRGIMDYSGICQTFGPALAYLYMCVGIDASEAGGLNVNPKEDAHSWTIFNIDGKHYYADSTFEATTNGNGLRYFGMTSKRREKDGYPIDGSSIGYNLMKPDILDISDDSFEELSNCSDVIQIKRYKDRMEISYLNDKGEENIFKVIK